MPLLLGKRTQMYNFLIVFFVSGAVAECPGKVSFFISTPKNISALAGSCLHIPCNHSQPWVDTRNAYGLWIKTDPRFRRYPNNVVFNGSKQSNIYPMEIIGDLLEGNCTTLFSKLVESHTGEFFFRLESSSSSFKATASCSSLQITVHESAPKPTIEISKVLKEAESVTFTCSAPTPCPRLPPRLTWSLQQDARSQLEENSDGTLTTKIQQIITLSERHDGLKLSCSAVYPVDGGQREKTSVAELTLSVSYAPKNTSASISPSALVSAGSWVNLTCSSRAKPAVSRYTWFRISDGGDVNVFEGDFYGFNVTEGGVYYCVAANHVGNETSNEILLTVGGIDQSSLLGLIVGGILGIVIVICLVIILRRLKSSRPSLSHQTQSLTPREFADGEEIHYGEIDFSALRPKPDSRSQQQTQTQTEVVYSQIHWCRTGNESEQTGPGSLYAEIVCK
ncbi:unnamed protein product [Ophioblennius macclurei]